MAVIEHLGKQMKKMQQDQPAQLLASLITEERAQKLDLLVHLVSNLKQSLIICGPQGIGKSTLLEVFQARTESLWAIVFLSGSESLNFESIQEKLLQGLTSSAGNSVAQNLNTILRGLQKLNRRVVLLIDDAGFLAPGIMTTLMQYATTYGCLRVVFALTDEELAVKRTSDPSVDACYFVEVPALSETQCGEYLQHLSGQLDASEMMAEVAANLAQARKDPRASHALNEQLYQQTKGIPGHIAEALPNLLPVKGLKGLNFRYLWVVAGALTLAMILLVINRDKPAMLNSVTLSEAPLSIPGQTVPEKTPEVVIPPVTNLITPVVKPPVTVTLGKPDLYKGYGRAREGDALDDFKEGALGVTAPSEIATQVDVKIMPVEPSRTPLSVSASGMPAVPSGMAEADIVMNKQITETIKKASQAITEQPKALSHNNISIGTQPPNPLVTKQVEEDKAVIAKEAKLLKQKEQQAKKQAEAQRRELLAKKQKAEALEKIKLKQQELAEKEALQIAEYSKAKIVLPDDAEMKTVAVPLSKLGTVRAKEPAKEKDAKEIALVKPKNPMTIEAKTKSTPIPDTKATNTPVKTKDASAKSPSSIGIEVGSAAEKTTGGHYTLQVMSFTQRSLVDAFMKKYSAMQGNLKMLITINSGGTQKYAVVYGSFDSQAEANAAKHKLPVEFRSAWVRKM